MTERTYSKTEARSLAVEAAQEALARFAVTHPLPISVTLEQAAKMLECSTRTVGRMGLPRLAEGKIPYSAILEKLDAKRSKAG
jgi:hypothetical protein